jgi:1-acyl-sn-glycerol-3-phosphate acyltransferase
VSPHLAQRFLGFFCYVLFVLPYVRRIRGRPSLEHRLYVCNHVSLLDTIALGGVFWSRRRLPILVLGDRGTWRKSRLRRFLSAKVGHLIERGRPVKTLIEELRAYARRRDRFNLIVFPEGTRGDGVRLGDILPGVYYVAKEAGVPVVPVRIEGMQRVSSKGGRFRVFRGLRRVTITFGQELEVGGRGREDFLREVRQRLAAP